MSVKTFILSSIAFLTASAAHGITPETPDSLRVNPSRPDTLGVPALYPELPQTTGISTSPSLQRLDSRFAEEMKERAVAPLFSTRGLYVPAPGYASIASLPGLEIAASGGSESLPGLAGIERGRLSATAALGPLALSAWGGAEKYGYFGGLQTIYGFGGSINYRISPRLSLTAYGSYFTAPRGMNPAIGGMMSMTTVGGYMSYDLSEHWGVSVGAETTRSIFDGRWHAQPIVMPYYKVNENVSIGANIGGIVYGLLENYIDSRNARHRRMPPPPQGPRR